MPTGIRLTDEQLNYVLDNFADMTNTELAKTIGVSRSCICNIQQRHQLKKSQEHYHLMGVKAGKASDKARGGKWPGMCQEVIDKRAATYNATRKSEEIRYKWGLPQKTKIKLRKEPRQKHDQRIRLEKFGYIIDEINLIAYYTPETRRAKRLEAIPRGKKVGSIKPFYEFRPYEEKQ